MSAVEQTWHVEPAGEARHERSGRVVVSKASVSEQDNNCYVVTSLATGAQVLVDAADAADRVLAVLDEAAAAAGHASRDLRLVVTTHGHWDHHRALAAVLAVTGADAAAGEADLADLPVADVRGLHHADVLRVDDIHLQVVHLRGHTPGSVALRLAPGEGEPDVVLTGDSLFPGGVGNTWQDPERFASLLADVRGRLFDVLDDDAVVHPGHGDSTTIGAQRGSLDDWQQRGW